MSGPGRPRNLRPGQIWLDRAGDSDGKNPYRQDGAQRRQAADGPAGHIGHLVFTGNPHRLGSGRAISPHDRLLNCSRYNRGGCCRFHQVQKKPDSGKRSAGTCAFEPLFRSAAIASLTKN
jgi:hypothetical protein